MLAHSEIVKGAIDEIQYLLWGLYLYHNTIAKLLVLIMCQSNQIGHKVYVGADKRFCSMFINCSITKLPIDATENN